MPLFGSVDDLDRVGSGAVPFKRHFLLPGIVLTGAEIVLIVLPIISMFKLTEQQGVDLWRISVPVLAGAVLIWFAALSSWFAPLQRAVNLRRRGKRLPKELAESAYRATWRVPIRALLLRTGLWVGVAVAHGAFFVRGAEWEVERVVQLASLTGMHAFATNLLRALWYAGIMGAVRGRLFSKLKPLRQFADGYLGRLILVACVASGAAMIAVAAFLFYFMPITLEQYLQIQSYFPTAVAMSLVAWSLFARRSTRDVDVYVEAHLDGDSGGDVDTTATKVYRRAQALPYALSGASLLLWVVIAGVGAWIARSRLRFELDDAVLMFGIATVVAVGSSIYESLWHRESMRPLLGHLTLRHRLPVRGIPTSLSLRTKLLLSFGGVVLLACGLALFWGFIQYKNLVTGFVSKKADLGLAWLRSEVQAAAAASETTPTPDLVRTVLQGLDKGKPESAAVYYFRYNDGPDTKVVGVGGGPIGAPTLPWYAVAKLKSAYDDTIELSSLDMAGKQGPLSVVWRRGVYRLGSVAVFYPNYRGRGQSVVRPLKELLVFFLVLFGACGGIVLFTVAQFVTPIRKLEQRADGMARGELAEPVSSGGEGDEIGRLTFALEEMRRALRDKLRSTEEVNLDLERAVQRRTADLAKKNRELAETLDKLTRTQDQLVRSEKMASIGQLVAGIAHEINNPVNAIVNTVGPLQQAIGDLDDEEVDKVELAEDIRDMIRVVQRGADRTKGIVRALHNYSRTDDESVVDFDLNRSIEDSLELLRHMLKQNIKVERDYGDAGRVRGHAGQLNQVFVNLLANAAQAVQGKDDATIWVETSERDGSAVITLRDNGPGIPPDVLPRIFDPFFTTKDVGEGTGLGLSIVHQIVERHGGTTEVDSEVGVGTSFTIVLPKGQDPVSI